jgi:hypothetical protein
LATVTGYVAEMEPEPTERRSPEDAARKEGLKDALTDDVYMGTVDANSGAPQSRAYFTVEAAVDDVDDDVDDDDGGGGFGGDASAPVEPPPTFEDET